MDTNSDPPSGELQHVAKELERFAHELQALSSTAIPFWILAGRHNGLPEGAALGRRLFDYSTVQRHRMASELKVRIYQDDYQRAHPILCTLKSVGELLASMSDASKAFFFHWCRHCYQEEGDYFAQAIDALFLPVLCDGDYLCSGIRPTYLLGVTILRAISRSPELHSPNLALSAEDAIQKLVERLGSTAEICEPEEQSDFCCEMAREEDRIRPKKPKEMLPRIGKLRSAWTRGDDYGPENPQRLVDDLWSDMILLGWQPPPCPQLPEATQPRLRWNESEHRLLWRAYQDALAKTEEIASRHAAGDDETAHWSGTPQTAMDIQPAVAPPAGLQSPLVDERLLQIRYENQAYSVTSEGARMMKLLVDSAGEWVSMSKNAFSKPSDVKKQLPQQIQALIESQRGKGYRIRRR